MPAPTRFPSVSRSVIAPLLGGALLLGAAVADAKPLRIHASGASTDQAELDLDGDGQGATRASSHGRSNFGTVDTDSVFDLAPWDGVSFCDLPDETADDDPGIGFGFGDGIGFGFPTGPRQGLLRTYVGGSSVTHSHRGDHLVMRMDTAPPSTACVDPMDGSFTFEIHMVVDGGTGLFDGATGSAAVTGDGRTLQDGFRSFTASTRGEIELQRRYRHRGR